MAYFQKTNWKNGSEMMKTIQIILILMTLFVSRTAAQNKISSSVLGNGGTTISGNNNRIAGTLGQNLIGVSSNANNASNAGFWYQTADIITSVEQVENDLLPTEFRLEQNYPNPFNPSTTIQFSVPKTSHVTIKIYNILGREVAALIDEEYQPGQYKVVFEAGQLASGLYVYRIQAGDFLETKKLMLLK